ncbi:cubilin-like isoform X2 [Haliotis rubra]|uniref:cubilin-like isoform X2 n=1 Tax=Haliotis rubra TaxID=36100 RepID=UPI001EE5FB2F|nr:cubilin-like isoform X2 [Haliotis rubra]
MPVLHESSPQRQDAIMNIPYFFGLCVFWLYGPLVSGACNVTLHAQREPLNFTSPNYPGNYGNHENCYWDIYPETSGYRVVLEMVFSNIQYYFTCNHDVLTIDVINNGDQSKASSRKICGESRWNILIEDDQHIHAVFTTDASGTRSGFLIRYYEKNGTETCGVPLVATSVGKTFTSPGYPNTYFQRQTCTWTITAEHQNQTIQLYTMDSVLQNVSSRGTCNNDYVTVYNGQYGSYQLGTFCGNERPVFNSGGNALSVRLRTDSSQVYKGFKMLYKAIPATTCSVTLSAGYSPMVIVSPGYPSNYVNGLDCQWTLNAPIGSNITVKVLFLDLEKVASCVDDYLLFKDGSANDARQLAKICDSRSTPIVSSSNHMTIMFHSDHAVTGGGFRLQYSSAFDCGLSDLSASSVTWKYLTSPGYPSNYYNNVHCEWKIRAPYGYEIKVEIIYLSLEYSSSCSRDYLVFKDGSSSWSPQLGKYCGVYYSKQLVSSINYITIAFHTDGSTTRQGYNLKYKAGIFPSTTTTTTVCGEDDTISYETKYIESPNYPLSYPDNADCEWTISTSIDGYVIHVDVVYFNIEQDSSCSYDYVQLYDVTSYESSIGRWCGRDGPNTQTTGQTMKVKFHSDGSTSRSGFKLSFTAGEPTYDSAAPTNIGAILGGVFGGITAVGIATCCCCGLCFRKKSIPNVQQQRNRPREGTVSFINVPSYPQTPPTAPAVLPFMSPPPPSYNDVVKDDPPPYFQAVPLSDIQPVVTSYSSGASEHQGIDNPAGPS